MGVRSGVSLTVRLGVLVVVLLLLAAASLRWALQDGRSQDGLAYIGMGVTLIAITAVAHLLAVRHPDRPALEGAAWVLTVVVVVAVGFASLGVAVSLDGDGITPFRSR